MDVNPIPETDRGLEPVDDQRINILRLLLSVTALAVILIDPSEPDRLVEITYITLVLYCIYSLFLAVFDLTRRNSVLHNYGHWIDVVWYTLLISLSSGTVSIFFFFYLFSVLVAAFRWGFSSGIIVSIAAASLFILAASQTTLAGEFELNRLILRPVYLLLLGYLISFWGGRELLSRKRLWLLSELNRILNPRFGTIRAIESILSHIRRFYDARDCILVLENSAGLPNNWFESENRDGVELFVHEDTEAGRPLLETPGDYSIIWRRHLSLLRPCCSQLYVNGGTPSEGEKKDQQFG